MTSIRQNFMIVIHRIQCVLFTSEVIIISRLNSFLGSLLFKGSFHHQREELITSKV